MMEPNFNIMKETAGHGHGFGGGMGLLLGLIFGAAISGNGGGLFGGNNNRGAEIAAINANTERVGDQTLNAIGQNAILGSIAGVKDTVQATSSAQQLATLQGFSNVQTGLGEISREICESNCATQRLVETSSAAGIAATNANGNRIADLTNQSKWDLSSQINNVLTSLTLQSQALSSKVDMGFCTTNQNILNSKCEIINAIKDDGSATRALINANVQKELERELAETKAALLEEREDHRATKTQVNIGSTVQSGIGNSQNAITGSVVNGVVAGLSQPLTEIKNVLLSLNANLNSLANANSSSNVNINTVDAYSRGSEEGFARARAMYAAPASK